MHDIEEDLKKLEEEKKKLELEREDATELEKVDKAAKKEMTKEEALEKKLFKERKKERMLESKRNAFLSKLSNNYELIALIGLIVIMAFDLFYLVRFVIGPSFYGDDATYLSLAASVVYSGQPGIPPFIESSYIFSTRILQILPIAFFYALFGVSLLSDAAWDIVAFVGTVAIVYIIGRKIHSRTAGIIAALLFSAFPLVVMLAPTVSDDITMMFMASLAMLAILYAEREHSKRWYFASGLFLVASPIVTTEGFIIIIVAVLYLLVEFIRKKIKIDRTLLYLVYGLLLAGIMLMAYNYLNCGNPLITLKTNSNFYSQVGPKGYIPSTNTDPCFYIDTMFPYNLLFSPAPLPYGASQYASCVKYVSNGLLVNFILGRLSIGNVLQAISSNYNFTGFFFYFFVIAAIYLAIRKVRGSFFVLFWFFAAFIYLEFGPMHLSLLPFNYLMMYRLQRFLTLIAPPTVLAIGIWLAEPIHKLHSKKKHIKKYIWIAFVIIVIVFLISTSLSLDIFWYNSQIYLTYDQLAIAHYLSKLPPTTRIYFASSFSFVSIYMKYENMSRFYAYDQIENCHDIPNDSYIIIPKYQEVFGLDYTPNPNLYCPSWRLVLSPNITKATGVTYSEYIQSMGIPFGAKLYYVPGNIIKGQQSNSTLTNSSNIASNSSKVSYNYVNLTGVGVLEGNVLKSFVIVNKVSNVTVSMNKTAAAPGEIVSLNVTFIGNFLWNTGGSAVVYYLSAPLLRNIHYYGVELSNQTGKLYDQNNGPWYYYVTQIGEPHQILYNNSNEFLRVHWNITPTANVIGDTLKICGGYFATYANTTLMNGYGNLFNNLSMHQVNVVNNSVINIPSSKCAYLKVE